MTEFLPIQTNNRASPLVTVAMPVFNGGRHLHLAVLSIMKQTYQNWELLIFDDGSTDNAFQDIAEIADPRIMVLRDGCNRGLAARLNQAVDMARGEYFARMDSDDVSYPERFSRQIEALQNDCTLDLVATRTITIDEYDQVTGLFPYAISHQEICSQVWRGFYFPHPTWMGRTEWFRTNRYATPALYCCEDQELLLRSYRSSRFATLDELLFAYRIRSEVDWQKLARTRSAIVSFQMRYFSRLGLWHFAVLAIASYVAKMIRDLFKRIFGIAVYPGHDRQVKSQIHEWQDILGGLATEATQQ